MLTLIPVLSIRILSILTILGFVLYSNVVLAQDDFVTWADTLKQEAIESGISEATVTATLNHIELLPDVIEMDHSQPEFISPFLDYYTQRVDARKIARGRELLSLYDALLNKIEAQYGVPKALLVAFWGMETNFGDYQGNIDTLSALATLAYDGRRVGFFRNQLLDAMRIIDSGDARVTELRGSWAGAFGNMQFMPSTFMAYAVDADGDNHIDIVNSMSDAFASAANYLSQAGWHDGELAMIEVYLPHDFKWKNAQLNLRKPVGDWEKMGVRYIAEVADADERGLMPSVITVKHEITKKSKSRKHAHSFHKKTSMKNRQASQLYSSTMVQSISYTSAIPKNVSVQAAILLPQGWRGPAFMVFDNFDVVMDWNHSVNYALSVVQLAKRINHESRIVGGQSAEAGALTFQQMFELQDSLNQRGFDSGEPDGFPGLQTQAAVRAYQLSQHLPADGYASPSLLNGLLSDLHEQKLE
ncbi:membrane-bound lytic murein transglycosylase B precursor [mine drainage metagenome]|uniref:Membrane-bound lytic murein transglycosylase B n=1 Tax=mine drainage metagenome TaxID=410659 RepID=A0A1J5RXD0_9ZZZZ